MVGVLYSCGLLLYSMRIAKPPSQAYCIMPYLILLLKQSLKEPVPLRRAGSGVQVENVWQWVLCVTDMLTAVMEPMKTTLCADTEQPLVSHGT